MPSALVNINGRPLFVEISGEGPPLIALHGLGGSTALFPIAPELSKYFTVIRFDFEGAGKSPLSGAGLSMPKFVEDVKAVLEYAGFAGKKAVVFGHSLGAATGLHFAATHPDLMSALILSCPGVPRSGTPEGRAASLALAATAREKGPFNMADFTAMKNTGPNATCVMKYLVRMAMQLSTPEGYAQTCEMISVTGAPEWEKITTKVMILGGVHDQISSVAAAETIAGFLTKTSSVKVEPVEAGHQPAVEVSDDVLSLMKSFLGY